MFPEKQCPLCDGPASVYQPNSVAARIECPKCGRFKVARKLYTTVLKHKNSDDSVKELLPYVSAHTCQASERGEEILLDDSNWKDFAIAHKHTPLSRRITKLLELVASRSEPGSSVTLNPAVEAPLVDAKSKQQMGFLLDHLVKTGCLQKLPSGQYVMEVKGWEYLQPTAGIPGKCFVAMWFHEGLYDAYHNGIYLAVKRTAKWSPFASIWSNTMKRFATK